MNVYIEDVLKQYVSISPNLQPNIFCVRHALLNRSCCERSIFDILESKTEKER